MDYQKLPFFYDSTKDISQFPPKDTEPHSQMHRLQILCIQECFRTGNSSVMPDSHGCETIFLEKFLTEEMLRDFPVIFQDFVRHEHSNLLRYAKESATFQSPIPLSPERRLQQKLFYMMYSALKQHSVYAACLFQKLYKTYYSQEYQQLKRFHSITYQDIISLADNPKEDDFISATARILTASTLFPIERDPNCAAIHFALNRHVEKQQTLRKEHLFTYSDTLFQQCSEAVMEMTRSIPEDTSHSPELKTYHMLTQITVPILLFFGYPKDYIIPAKDNLPDLQKLFSQTLTILKRKYPKKIFSLEEVQAAAVLYSCISMFCSRMDAFDVFVDLLFSDTPTTSDTCRFRPDKLSYQPVLAVPQTTQPEPEPAPLPSDKDWDSLQTEITALRARLEQQEQETRHLRTLYSESRNALSKADTTLQQYKNDRQELIALRNHVYHLTEDDSVLLPADINAMSHAIAQKRIIIIGGHSNWTYKLRNRFPSWSFLSPKTSGSVDNRLLKRADYVYFFTNVIKHCTYMRFIRIVRDQNIPFGYIHNINIQSNIQQIYKDISAAGL